MSFGQACSTQQNGNCYSAGTDYGVSVGCGLPLIWCVSNLAYWKMKIISYTKLKEYTTHY